MSRHAWVVAAAALVATAAGVLVARLDAPARTFVLLAPFVVAAAIDVRTRRIPNALSAGALTLALAVAVARGSGVEAALGAFVALGGGIVLAVAARGAFGMGDVKLMAGAGAVAGVTHVLAFLVAMAIAGGVLALVVIAVRRGARASTMPYGPAIALGVADVVLWLR
ncbi:MAG: prepilin peptidase [Dehalococcoidia bacterium]